MQLNTWQFQLEKKKDDHCTDNPGQGTLLQT